MKRVAVIFHRIGPYHFARLKAAGCRLDVTAIELGGGDRTYAWSRLDGADRFERVTLFPDRDISGEPASQVVRRVHEALEAARPTVVAIPGWSECGALAALAWSVEHRVPAVLMSESQEQDGARYVWKELPKSKVVRLCAAALVGGRPHVDYLAKLGLPRGRIFTGYDVVDNAHFAVGADVARQDAAVVRRRLALPEPYFLASSRFVERKNLPGLLQAYARYQGSAGSEAWKLVLLGDGAQRPELEILAGRLGIADCVVMPGFEQYDELPAYYGLAGAFVHASALDPWGLVVNEAMAAGLPVLVSKSCGCAPDLVEPGRNGFTFDPHDVQALADLMGRVAAGTCDRQTMGAASRQIVARWTPETFALGLQKAAEAALELPPSAGPSHLSHALLWMLTRRPTSHE